MQRPDLPLEQLVCRATSASQASFAITAKRLMDHAFAAPQPVDFALSASAGGLVVLARHEDALSVPLGLLREIYRDCLLIAPARPRMMEGVPAREPLMGVRISVRASYLKDVQALLRRRNASPVEERSRSPHCILRCEAPLADLLGLPAELSRLTQGSANYCIVLSRYAVVGQGESDHGTVSRPAG